MTKSERGMEMKAFDSHFDDVAEECVSSFDPDGDASTRSSLPSFSHIKSKSQEHEFWWKKAKWIEREHVRYAVDEKGN